MKRLGTHVRILKRKIDWPTMDEIRSPIEVLSRELCLQFYQGENKREHSKKWIEGVVNEKWKSWENKAIYLLNTITSEEK